MNLRTCSFDGVMMFGSIVISTGQVSVLGRFELIRILMGVSADAVEWCYESIVEDIERTRWDVCPGESIV